MLEYVVHIGPHKTATTYIQATLHALRERLLSNGVLFPTEWCLADDNPSHWRLFDLIRNGEAATLDRQFRHISDTHRGLVVISAEDLAGLREPEIRKLRHALGDAPARVVYYCRRPSELLPACWQEHVKHGGYLTLPEYVAGQLLHSADSQILNWRLVLDRYAAVFGTENLLLVSFSNAVDAGMDIAQHFLDAVLGLSHRVMSDASIRRANASLDAAEVEVIRVLNSMHRSHGGEASDALRVWYTEHGRSLVPAFLGAAMATHVGWMTIDDGLAPFEELHRNAFRAYGNALINPSGDASLYSARKREARYIRPDYTTSFMVAELIRHIYDQYRRTSIREVA